MSEPSCQGTTVTQHVSRCNNGTVEKQTERLYVCTLGNSQWTEWRPEGTWTSTGEEC